METLITQGGLVEIKSIDERHVAGYLVTFGSPSTADLTPMKDFFSAATDFDIDWDEGAKASVYFEHGQDDVLKKTRLGRGTLTKTDAGIWIDAYLERRADYEAYVEQLLGAAKDGKLGWSSGSAAHLLERERVGGAHHVKRWPIIDATMTFTPADWRSGVIAIKSLINAEDSAISSTDAADAAQEAQPEAAAAAGGAAGANGATKAEISFATQTEGEMPEETPVTAPAVTTEAFNALKAEHESLLAIIEGSPALKNVGFFINQGGDGATAEDAVKSAFMDYVRTGNKLVYQQALNAAAAADPAIKAAMQVGTDSEGGYLVPTTYSNELVQSRREGSLLRMAGARVITSNGVKAFKVPTLTDSTRAILTAEEAAFSQVEPTVGEVEFNPYKYTKLVKVSDELLTDSQIDVVSQIITPDAANAFALGENVDFTVGTGSSQPQGVVTGSSLGVTAASASAITADEVIDLYHSLGYLYRPNAIWMMNDATLKVIRKLKDTTNQYLWAPGLAGGQPETILGRPVMTNNNMATIATGVKSIIFGDMSYLWIVDFGPMYMKRLEELYAGNGQVGFRWYGRYDSNVMLSAAIKHLIQA